LPGGRHQHLLALALPIESPFDVHACCDAAMSDFALPISTPLTAPMGELKDEKFCSIALTSSVTPVSDGAALGRVDRNGG